MKTLRLFFTLFCLSIILLDCSTISHNRPVIFKELSAADLENAKPYVWQELLKEYFLCECITEGFKDKQIDENDISQAGYFDILRYSPEAFHEVKDYASIFVTSIKSSHIEDLGFKKAIISDCIGKYKSKELDEFIKSLDKYMLKD